MLDSCSCDPGGWRSLIGCRFSARGVFFRAMESRDIPLGRRIAALTFLFCLCGSLFVDSLTPDAEAAWPMYSKSTQAKKFRRLPPVAADPGAGVKALAEVRSGIHHSRNRDSEADKRRRYNLAMRYGIDGLRTRGNSDAYRPQAVPEYGQGW